VWKGERERVGVEPARAWPRVFFLPPRPHCSLSLSLPIPELHELRTKAEKDKADEASLKKSMAKIEADAKAQFEADQAAAEAAKRALGTWVSSLGAGTGRGEFEGERPRHGISGRPFPGVPSPPIDVSGHVIADSGVEEGVRRGGGAWAAGQRVFSLAEGPKHTSHSFTSPSLSRSRMSRATFTTGSSGITTTSECSCVRGRRGRVEGGRDGGGRERVV